LEKRKSYYSSKKGFTLVEVMITLAVFSIIIGAIHQVFVAGQKAWNSDLSLLDLQQASRRGIHGLVREIRAASLGSISISESDTKIEFDTPSENNIQFFLNIDDSQLIRQDSLGVQRILASNVEDVAFAVVGDSVVIDLRTGKEKTTWSEALDFPLRTQVKVRND